MEIRKCTETDVVSVGAFYDDVVAYLCRNINYPKWVYKEYPSETSAAKMTAKDCQFLCLDQDQIREEALAGGW